MLFESVLIQFMKADGKLHGVSALFTDAAVFSDFAVVINFKNLLQSPRAFDAVADLPDYT